MDLNIENETEKLATKLAMSLTDVIYDFKEANPKFPKTAVIGVLEVLKSGLILVG